MLSLDNILWVLPGVAFIYLHNRWRPSDRINLTGWPYIFLLVVVASVTWLPAELFSKRLLRYIDVPETSLSCFDSLVKSCIEIFGTECSLIIFHILITIALWVFLIVLLQIKPIASLFFPKTDDNFHNKCMAWENKTIILTLKNRKTYIGTLWKYPEDPSSRYDLQTISMIPLRSGYRGDDDGKICWNTTYPDYENKTQLEDTEVIIPRREILSFGKFNNDVFEYINNGTIEYENKFLHSQEDVDKFREQVKKEGLELYKTPWFVPKEDVLSGGYVFCEDVHMRLYHRPGSKMGIRAIYFTRLEWEPDSVINYKQERKKQDSR